MELFPAIDIKNGQVVRLTQGDYNQVEVYSTSPLTIAQQFEALGARNLHVVDLDGARDGQLSNFDTIRQIASETGLHIQVGGGIRDEKRIGMYLDAGVQRVILGTVAAERPALVKEMVAHYGEAIAVGVDARDGKVAVHGWLDITDLDAFTFCRTLEELGVRTIIYTDITRDGMMAGTNLEIYHTLSQRLTLSIIASGGITYLPELTALRELGLYGAIVGKALYTKDISLKEALAVCS